MHIAEILQHRIEWELSDEYITELDDTNVEHIAYMISQGFSEGDLNQLGSDDEELRGYWKIAK